MALAAAVDNLGDGLRVIAEHIRVFLENRGADPRLDEAGGASSKMSADGFFSPGNVASFRMQMSRTTLKIRLRTA
jgi:hypothetical protein